MVRRCGSSSHTWIDMRIATARQPIWAREYQRRLCLGLDHHVPLIARSFAARKVPIIIGIYLPVIEVGLSQLLRKHYWSEGIVSVHAADCGSLWRRAPGYVTTWKR